MNKVAVIGAGISGLSVADLLKDRFEVTVFEKERTPGGLVRCERVDGSLFHICGGHVFNTKNQAVLDWFWRHFDRDTEFTKADRNAVVVMEDGLVVPYPIENHFYMFGRDVQERIRQDLLEIKARGEVTPADFRSFLIGRFGPTLYEMYFKPYNTKVWRRDLGNVPLSWLEGKLPMPTVDEIFYNNEHRVEEKSFVHSSFWYEKEGGSQFIIDRLSEGLDIRCGREVPSVRYDGARWNVDGEMFDKVVFCGNVKALPKFVEGVDLSAFAAGVAALEYHGTTSVFCEIDRNPYSWIYQPSVLHESHRIICTGNFAASNNAPGKMTATVEFTDEISLDDILDNLGRIPFHPKYLAHHFSRYSYPIQDSGTRTMIAEMKQRLEPCGFYFTGRFADWEYYNMDAAMAAAMATCSRI